MQFTAPVDDSVSVTDPAAHTAHATVDALLYCPAEHASQLTAPTEPKVSVTDPAEHTRQLVCAVSVSYTHLTLPTILRV